MSIARSVTEGVVPRPAESAMTIERSSAAGEFGDNARDHRASSRGDGVGTSKGEMLYAREFGLATSSRTQNPCRRRNPLG
jgi:hypothetical protein